MMSLPSQRWQYAETYLKDETGNRRFLPIRCGVIDLQAIERDRNQLWAEAVAKFKAGEPWWLTETGEVSQAKEEQASRYQQDPWQEVIARHVEERTDVSISEILSDLLLIEKGKQTQGDQNRVARCLITLDWERYQTPRPARAWRYRRRVSPV
jgi:predicted P-loop ATPase